MTSSTHPVIDPQTRVGHVHLRVANLDRALSFYHGILGFDITVRMGDSAAFLSAGGYHHHIGLNTWHSAGGGPPAPDAVGLRSFEVLLPGAAELDLVLARIAAAGPPSEAWPAPGGWLIADPSGNLILLRSR